MPLACANSVSCWPRFTIGTVNKVAVAIHYARTRWVALTRYPDMPDVCFQHDGRLEISNNVAENQVLLPWNMPPPAMQSIAA